MFDFDDLDEAFRRIAGIDGTAGDAQDVSHWLVRDEETGACRLCGLSDTYRKHKLRTGRQSGMDFPIENLWIDRGGNLRVWPEPPEKAEKRTKGDGA
jgi:hypothetical protein